MPAADWMPIPPRYGRLLGRLKDQRRVDPFGGIGWLALVEEPEVCKSTEQLFEPLLGRAMISDCVEQHGGPSGKFFARATDFGLVCLSLGYMPRGRVAPADVQRWADEIPKLNPDDLKRLAVPNKVTR